jgi:hypothetical protein
VRRRGLTWLIAVLAGGLVCAQALADAPGAPRLRIEPMAAFDTLGMAGPGAWSPRGTLLALTDAPAGKGPSRIWVFDPARPGTPARMVYDAGQWIRMHGWSPDGGWLLLVVGDAHPENHRTLVAVPLDGSTPDTLLAGVDIWLGFWGADGFIHYRERDGWSDLRPPPRWQPGRPYSLRAPLACGLGPNLALVMGTQVGGRASDFQELVCFGTFREDEGQLKIIDALPNDTRFLVAISQDTSAVLALVDGHGQSLTNLRSAGIRFEPSAISADGRLIVGFTGDWAGEAGWTRTWLEACDAGGHWSARVAGGEGGEDPQMSREGSYLAFRTGKGTRVAKLVVVAH